MLNSFKCMVDVTTLPWGNLSPVAFLSCEDNEILNKKDFESLRKQLYRRNMLLLIFD